MNERRLLLVRHPETEANASGRYVGRGDSPFTALGIEQAARLARRIAEWGPDAVWSSPLRRALAVAEEAAALAAVPLKLDERLTELDFGEAEGLTFAETVERGIRFEFGSVDAPVAPGGESRGEIWRRSVAAAEDAVHAAARTAIVTHGGVFRSMLPHLLGLGIDSIWTFHVRNAQIAEIALVDGIGRLEEFTLG